MNYTQLPDRILDRIAFEPTSGCWLWTGKMSNSGYGRVWVGGRERLAHRAFYEASHGEIREGLELDHLCRTKLCVNPAHLEPVTPRENSQRNNRRIKKCVRGHEYSGDNVYVRPNGWRECRACRAEWANRLRPGTNRRTDA